MRRSLKIGVRLGVLAGAVLAAAKLVNSWRAPAADRAKDNGDGGRLAVPRPLRQPQSQPAEALREPTPTTQGTPVASPPAVRPASSVEPVGEQSPAVRPSVEPQLVSPTMLESVTNRPATAGSAGTNNGGAASTRSSTGSAAAAKAKAEADAKPKAAPRAWIEPQGTVCPTSHPVKGKLSSKLYHLPGMLVYERTHPDRCYLDGDAAEADGFTRAKR